MLVAFWRSGGVAEAAGFPCQRCSHPAPCEALHCLSQSQPMKSSSPGAAAFKHCQSSHSSPHSGASSASVMMTQPEPYLEVLDTAPCPGPSQSDRRFPEHLGLWFKGSSSQGMGVRRTFLTVCFLLGRGPICWRNLLESRSPSILLYNVIFLKIHTFYKACKTWQRKKRKAVRKWV